MRTTEIVEPWEVNNTDNGMKKKRGPGVGKSIIIVIIIGVVAGLIGGIVSNLSINGCMGIYQRNTVPFSEMEYVRPDKNAIFGRIDDAVDSISANEGSYDDQLALVRDYIPDY